MRRAVAPKGRFESVSMAEGWSEGSAVRSRVNVMQAITCIYLW
nr:MAG TPA: hypothetical protein [Caudoviricetes sp.]